MERSMCAWPVAVSAAVVLSLGSAGAQGTDDAPLDLERLSNFLVEAKRAGYASGDDSRVRTLEDRGGEVTAAHGDFTYRDRWYGGTAFSGQEVVWYRGRPVWSLNFYGAGRPGTEAPPESFTKFHKSALREVEASAPFRGPTLYREGDFEYLCETAGSIEAFQGVERVLYRGAEVYRLRFHGGLTNR